MNNILRTFKKKKLFLLKKSETHSQLPKPFQLGQKNVIISHYQLTNSRSYLILDAFKNCLKTRILIYLFFLHFVNSFLNLFDGFLIEQ